MIFHTNILEAVTVPILVNAWIWTSISLCKLTLPFGLGYLACSIWNPFDLLFRPNIFPSIFAGVFCSILVPQPIHHWLLSQTLTFSLLHYLLGFPYPSHFWTFKSRNLQAVKLLFSTLVPSMCCICQADNTSILLCLTFCRDIKLQKTPEFLLILFCWVLGILCYLNKVADRVSIPFLYPQWCWPSYPTKTLTISGILSIFWDISSIPPMWDSGIFVYLFFLGFHIQNTIYWAFIPNWFSRSLIIRYYKLQNPSQPTNSEKTL